ncbi:hypothetical protein JAAARDRAFT_62514 [Jaapia argillacea MUCL 33604]|uniref:CxC5 like cysteine cluster associated with KDZ domain-containing protein n=1 Tax=Jaapia argillacea MUCL 33604 TaxID=933084 RepID=A0A067PMB3_9AGAM|nr:hypothetical protein JAAARDRAFT_62514 [Jaapia argillacea MUCL 33604]
MYMIGIAPGISAPLFQLDHGIKAFLCSALNLPQEELSQWWETFSEYAWHQEAADDTNLASRKRLHLEESSNEPSVLRDGRYLNVFFVHGLPHEVGFYDIEPPTRVCLDPQCRQQNGEPLELTEWRQHPATLFTCTLGLLPVWSHSLYCRKCQTRYHPNYYIHDNATQRTYYLNVLHLVQASKHFYLEAALCERFRSMMVCACVLMDCDNVWDAFFLYGLLKDHAERGSHLVLEHRATSQALQLLPALEERNAAMVGPGQPQWNHACQSCCEVRVLKDGQAWGLQAVVIDGITIGHPCCRVHNCKLPLPSQNATYCDIHSALKSKCAVESCTSSVGAGFQTCALADHRILEEHHLESNRAMFQLKHCLEHLKISQPDDSLRTEGGGSGLATDELTTHGTDNLCHGKPDAGNRRFRAHFGRRWTHNEELCVATCGVILGCATFFGSEAPNGVQSLPGVAFHDNNCNVQKVIKSENDSHFKCCALPVDVFHMKAKHKESDMFCGMNCNPANWPALTTAEGKWRFNSSASEITNAWFGGFQVDRYNFFLDEMIKLRNELIIVELRQRKLCPYNIPREELLSAK